MKKVVVRVSLNAGDRQRSPLRSILINIGKLLMPCECIWKRSTATPAKNKIKALKVAVSFPGVQEASIQGDDKDQLTVKVDSEFDPVALVQKLRRKVASAVIVSVEAEKKDKEKEGKKDEKKPVIYHYPQGVPHWELVEEDSQVIYHYPEHRSFCGLF